MYYGIVRDYCDVSDIALRLTFQKEVYNGEKRVSYDLLLSTIKNYGVFSPLFRLLKNIRYLPVGCRV